MGACIILYKGDQHYDDTFLCSPIKCIGFCQNENYKNYEHIPL